MVTVTGMTAAWLPPEPLPDVAGTLATLPTAVTVPAAVVDPSGIVTVTWSPGRTIGPPTGSETWTPAVNDVPETTLVPMAIAAPGCSGVVVTRSGPGRKAIAPRGIAPVTARPAAHCHRCTASSVV